MLTLIPWDPPVCSIRSHYVSNDLAEVPSCSLTCLFLPTTIKIFSYILSQKTTSTHKAKRLHFFAVASLFFQKQHFFPQLVGWAFETEQKPVLGYQKCLLFLSDPNDYKIGSQPLKKNTCPVQYCFLWDFAAKEVSRDHYSQTAGHIKAALQIGAGTTNAPGFCLAESDMCLSQSLLMSQTPSSFFRE